MDLKTWFSSFLQDKKLQMALDKCDEAMIETLDDLIDLHQDGGKGELQQIFPRMLAMKIDKELAIKCGSEQSPAQTSKKDPTIEPVKAPTRDEGLPEGKK